MSDDERFVTIHKTLNEQNKPIFASNAIRTHKYRLLTFIPVNLFHQFSRVANFYFLIIICLLQFDWAPISASAAVIPLVIVIGISMIREGIEDFLRYRSDMRVNATPAKCVRNGELKEIRWDEILVGDIIYIEKNQQVPADIVLLASNHKLGVAYVDTCNLDGETNLKVKTALKYSREYSAIEQFQTLQGDISCDLPNNKLYVFNGNIVIGEQQFPLDNSNFILRGCTLRNTEYVYGAVTYTGKESKIMMNQNKARTKRSLLERGLNWKLISVFIIIFVLAIIASIIGYQYEKYHINRGPEWYFYRNEENKRNGAYAVFILIVSHIIIINAMIPISLYVTLEVVRVFQAGFIIWDKEMYDTELGIGCSSRTTNISDDLGQIKYIFSDKTGTLTRNVMDFMKCSVAGTIYGHGTTEVAYAAAKRRGITIEPPKTSGPAFDDPNFMKLLKSNSSTEINHFVWLLATCHEVIPEKDENARYGYIFQAPSPDEGALVEAAAQCGYVFSHRELGSMVVTKDGKDMEIELLASLEFTSARKRSSVIIKHPETGQIILYMKGADDTIMERLSKDSQYAAITSQHLREFSDGGLRTLCCGYRILDEEWARAWVGRLHEAQCLVQGREEAVERCAEEIEHDLLLLGATAIEDKLQEAVPDCIESLLKAGISVWVITGDKRETAINIGFACSLLSGDMDLVILDENPVSAMRGALQTPADRDVGLVASGQALFELLSDEYVDEFYELSLRAKSVICCRVSPLQKASIVAMMRKKTGRLAAAVGDGANDVGMILEADIGIGISGREGRQAVLASDYAIAKFKYLKRLILMHGRLCFYRNVELIFYCFYKNMAYTLNQIIYGFFSHFSGTTMYDSILYTIFNVIFTSAPPVVYAGADRDVSMEAMMEHPELFNMDGRKDWLQSYPRFLLNMLYGVFHALVAFFIPYFAMQPFYYPNGTQLSQAEFGVIVYQCVIVLVNIRQAALCYYWTWFHLFFAIGSVFIFPLVFIVLDYMGISDNLSGISVDFLASPQYWFCFLACAMVASITTVIWSTIESNLDWARNKVAYMERVGVEKKTTDLDERAALVP